MNRCWKIIGNRRQPLVSGAEFTYPADGKWTEHTDKIGLCSWGYHYCEGKHVLEWLNTGLLAEVEPCPKHKPKKGDNKNVTCQLRIVRTFPLTARVLRRFACDCAERALEREREHDREPDERSWNAVRVARRYAFGKATKAELDAAWDAARAAGAAEQEWQYHRLLHLVGAE